MLAAAGRSWRGSCPACKWSRKVENLHVTLKFLGEVEEERLTALGGALGGRSAPLPRFRVELRRHGRISVGASRERLWAGVDDVTGGWRPVAGRSRRRRERLGFAREERGLYAPT